jgi:glycosyltransferase involved in cell wall biosynthesis
MSHRRYSPDLATKATRPRSLTRAALLSNSRLKNVKPSSSARARTETHPRLLLLGSQMATGGAQHVLLTQATWFKRHGYRVSVAFFYDKEDIRAEWTERHSVEIVDLRAWRPEAGGLSNLRQLVCGCYRLFQLMRRERFDVVETFTHHANLLGLPIAWLAGVPKRIATHHGRPEMPSWLETLHSYLANTRIVTQVVVVSKHLREEASEVEHIRADKVSVILNGIPDHDATTDLRSAARRIRSELAVPDTGHLILSVGRLVPEKGHQYLIEALPSVIEQFPDTIVAIAGDGPLREPLQRRIDELGLEEVALLLGTRSDVSSLLAAADLLAHPSVREGLPLAMLEALSMGVAIVASTFDGALGLLEHERTALLAPTRDSQAFSAALVAGLASPQLRRRLSRAGAELIKRRFSMTAMCQSYDQLFRAT